MLVFLCCFFFFKQKGNKSLGRIAQKPHIQKELGYLSIDTKKINVRAASHPIQLSHPLQSSQGAAAVKSSGKTVCDPKSHDHENVARRATHASESEKASRVKGPSFTSTLKHASDRLPGWDWSLFPKYSMLNCIISTAIRSPSIYAWLLP